MHQTFRRIRALLAITAIVAASGVAYAACQPNNCAQLRQQCIDNGGTRCEMQYFRCMQNAGCPIP